MKLTVEETFQNDKQIFHSPFAQRVQRGDLFVAFLICLNQNVCKHNSSCDSNDIPKYYCCEDYHSHV